MTRLLHHWSNGLPDHRRMNVLDVVGCFSGNWIPQLQVFFEFGRRYKHLIRAERTCRHNLEWIRRSLTSVVRSRDVYIRVCVLRNTVEQIYILCAQDDAFTEAGQRSVDGGKYSSW
ncbi:unnamed protein product [Musa acuminata subsp. malaccensis]|uniref:(wild Malaysian banana) hypothetical protein n=1 Tax=Musa acuminata subsp. malaccensis TaxID=214687 RepID=A0A804IPS2_MUSAM|nr:PREDICTED: uncharacterized protein LOC103981455 [Musa acuminata subsp. malaccensis]CAG1842188.1 unnamed protein product [Musa acuminata subsp. malaccensis]